MRKRFSILAFLCCALPLAAEAAYSLVAEYYWKPGDAVRSDTKVWSTGVINPHERNPDSGESVTLNVVYSDTMKGWAVDHWRRYEGDRAFDNDSKLGDPISGADGQSSVTVSGQSGTVAIAVSFRTLKYKLHYDAQGGNPTPSATNGLFYTNTFALAGAPTKTGYDFNGWKDGAGKTWDAGASGMSGASFAELDDVHDDSHTVTLTALWTEKTYSIASSGENCTVSVSKTSGVRYAADEVTISWTPTPLMGHTRTFKSAEVFAGTSATGTPLKTFSSGTSGTFRMSEKNAFCENVFVRVVYADTTNRHAVNVVSAGNGSVSKEPSQSLYDFGSTVTIAAAPNTGYAFEKWNDGSKENPRTVTVGDADATFTATFTNRVYTLTFNANGGTFADGSSVSNVLIAWDCPLGELPQPSRARMERDGWWTEESGGQVVDRDTRYRWDYDRTVYMHWQESHLYKIRTVAQPAEGGSATGGGELAPGEVATLTATPNEGYSFERWSDGGAQTHDVVVGSEDKTYTATFTGNVYRVYFLMRDATGAEYAGRAPKSVWRTYGDFYDELPPAVLDDEALEFICWTDGDGNEITPETRVQGGDPQKREINLCVSARRRLFYTVAFAGEGATSGTMGDQKVYRDEETALASNDFKRTGYAFLGWAETNDLAKVKYFDGTNVLNIAAAGDTNELHAVWSANAYTVVFHANDGTARTTTQDFVYDRPQALDPCPFDRGELWRFVAWTNETDQVGYTNGETVVNLTTGGTYDLTAVWGSNLGDLSNAMGCTNLIWESSELHPGWVPGDGCAVENGHPGAFMYAKTKSAGTLSFEWKADDAGGYIYVGLSETKDRGGDIKSEKYDALQTEWMPVQIDVPASEGEAYLYVDHEKDGFGIPPIYVRNMKWVPAGGGVPTPGEAVAPTAAGVADGAFSLTIPAESGTDYGVWTNADLTVDSWGLMGEPQKGTGNPLKFDWTILPGFPQLFFRAHKVEYR